MTEPGTKPTDEYGGITAAQRARLARADRINFDTLIRAVEDIIAEHLGLTPVIPTGCSCWKSECPTCGPRRRSSAYGPLYSPGQTAGGEG